jgi:GNAT superfamily N-acetyltransferase
MPSPISMTEPPLTVRRAQATDLALLASYGFALGRLHVGFDGERFATPPGGESAYAEFFRAQMQRPEVVVLIAELGPQPVGYAFVRMEPMSLVEIRMAGAWLHDIYVDPEARRGGIGRVLLEAAKQEALRLGSSSLMLSASPHNHRAQALFASAGLRPTMVEMRIELAQPLQQDCLT